MAYQPIAIHAGELPWTGLPQDEQRFRIILGAIVFALMALAGTVPFLSLPKVEREKVEAVPPRLAKIVLEQRAQAKPTPPPKPQAAPPPPPPTGVERPKTEPPKPLTQAEQQARKRVQTKGLGALTSELAALADTSGVAAMAPQRVTGAGKTAEAASVDTRILTAESGRRSAGAGTAPLSHRATIETTKLEDNRQQRAQELLARTEGTRGGGTTARAAPGNARGSSGRAEEDVAVVMDKYKSLLYAIYNRARRSNPGLKGKIVLVITILPSGEVANVVTKSNELNAPDLEAALLARVRQFNFGATQGGPLTVTVPVEFLPS